MKRLLVIAMSLSLAYGASAQHGHTVVVPVYHGGIYAFQPRIGVGIGFGYYSPYFSPYGFYSYPFWAFPYGGYYPYGFANNSVSKLQKKEADIRSDYDDRIYSVRQDPSLSSKEKRQTVRSLKKQRNQEIHDLVVNYHKQPVPQNNVSQ